MKFLNTILLLTSLITLPINAFAEFSKHNTTEIKGNFNSFKRYLVNDGTKVNRASSKKISSSYKISPITLKTRLPGLGRVKINFDRKRISTTNEARFFDGRKFIPDNLDIKLFKGTAQIAEGNFPVSGAVINNQDGSRILKINLTGKRLGKARVNAYSLKVNLNKLSKSKTAKVSKSPISNTFSCISTAIPANQKNIFSRTNSIIEGSQIQAAAAFKVLEIAVYTDEEWYSKFGSTSNQEALNVLNAAETIYESQLQVSFEIISVTSMTSNPLELVTREASLLLANFGNWITNNDLGKTPDIIHLISGKDFFGSTSGVAWVGTVCHQFAQYYKTGVSQYTNSSVAHLIFAHELGHNFDATHDSSLPPSIMFPSMGTAHNQFSESSKNQILAYIAKNGSCLSETEIEVTPTPLNTPTIPGSFRDDDDENFIGDSEPTPGIDNVPTSPTVATKPTKPKRYQVRAKISFGKRSNNKKADKYDPKVYIKSPTSGITLVKKLSNQLKFGLKLQTGTYELSIELRKGKKKDSFSIGSFEVARKDKRIAFKLLPDPLNQSINNLSVK